MAQPILEVRKLYRGNVSSLSCTDPQATSPSTQVGDSDPTTDSDTICDDDPNAIAVFTTLANGDIKYDARLDLSFSEVTP